MAEGTNTGHENGEAMACVGVRVDLTVRLGREVEGFRIKASCCFKYCISRVKTGL